MGVLFWICSGGSRFQIDLALANGRISARLPDGIATSCSCAHSAITNQPQNQPRAGSYSYKSRKILNSKLKEDSRLRTYSSVITECRSNDGVEGVDKSAPTLLPGSEHVDICWGLVNASRTQVRQYSVSIIRSTRTFKQFISRSARVHIAFLTKRHTTESEY
jgi:hypothetical protein